MAPGARAIGFGWRRLRDGDIPSPRLARGDSQHLGKDTHTRRKKDVESKELQGLLAGKPEIDVTRNTQEHARAAWSRNTSGISMGNKNASVINDPLGAHSPYECSNLEKHNSLDIRLELPECFFHLQEGSGRAGSRGGVTGDNRFPRVPAWGRWERAGSGQGRHIDLLGH